MKKNIKNNWILISLVTFIFILIIVSSILIYFYKYNFWNFLKEWQSIFTPIFILFSYLIFFIFYIIYEKKWNQKKWKNKKKNELKTLYENNKRDDFVDYDNLLTTITDQVNHFFNFQNSQKYSTNLLLVNGKYGSGKTFIISNVLEKMEMQDNIYYIDLTTIENQSKNHFSKYLFNEIIKCISYQNYLSKLFNLKFFKIFSKNLPFNFATEEIIIKNEQGKILIIIDEIDRCEPDSIINTFTVLKNYCLNIKNVVFVVLLNENVIKPIIQDYFKNSKDGEQYNLFLDKLSNNIIKIENIFDFNFEKLDFLKNNKIIKDSIEQTNICLNKNLKTANQRNILRNITNKSLAQNTEIFKFLLKKIENKKILLSNENEVFDFIQYLILFKILISKLPEDIINLSFKKEQINTSFYFDEEKHLKFQKFININNNPIYKILPNKEIFEINSLIQNDYSILSTDEKGNLYATTQNSSKIWKINSEGQINEFADFKNDNHIISLSIDEKGNLYVTTQNSSKIWKIDISSWNQIKEVIDLRANNINLYLTCKNDNNQLFFMRDDDKQHIYFVNLNNRYFNMYWRIPEKVENYTLFFNKIIGPCLLVNKSKLYYKFKNENNYNINPQEIIEIKNKNIISINIDNQNNFYFTSLNDIQYEIKNEIKNDYYSYSLSKKNLTNILNLPYYNYLVLKENSLEEMNFLEFYFLTKKNIKFNFIYIKNEFLNELKDFEKIFKESYESLNIKNSDRIGIILEYKKNKYKIIFDLRKENLITYESYEDIWWKLSKIKNNKILNNYDHFVHKIIIDLLNNIKWSDNYSTLLLHLEKIENKKIIGNIEFHALNTTLGCEVDFNRERNGCKEIAKWKAKFIDESKNDICIPDGSILLCNLHKETLIDEKKILAYRENNGYFKL